MLGTACRSSILVKISLWSDLSHNLLLPSVSSLILLFSVWTLLIISQQSMSSRRNNMEPQQLNPKPPFLSPSHSVCKGISILNLNACKKPYTSPTCKNDKVIEYLFYNIWKHIHYHSCRTSEWAWSIYNMHKYILDLNKVGNVGPHSSKNQFFNSQKECF